MDIKEARFQVHLLKQSRLIFNPNAAEELVQQLGPVVALEMAQATDSLIVRINKVLPAEERLLSPRTLTHRVRMVGQHPDDTAGVNFRCPESLTS